jgi:hypothetical protein
LAEFHHGFFRPCRIACLELRSQLGYTQTGECLSKPFSGPGSHAQLLGLEQVCPGGSCVVTFEMLFAALDEGFGQSGEQLSCPAMIADGWLFHQP